MAHITMSPETLEQLRQGKATVTLDAGLDEFSGALERFVDAADSIEPATRRSSAIEAVVIINGG